MTYNKKHLNFDEQLDLFITRGMVVQKRDEAIEKLKNINYYKIKEFASPYYKNRYENITFEQVIMRFYQDKNLRIYLLHAIEKVELSFKTKFAYVLGKKYDAFGYLDFKNWCNKKEYCKHYLNEKQEQTKMYIKKIIKRKNNFITNEYFKTNPKEEFPPIWMLVEILTFGDILNLYELMSDINRKEIARFYDCTNDELSSWLKNLKLIRNLAAHNSCILDTKFITKPMIRPEWNKFLFVFQTKNNKIVTTDRIAITIVIIKYLISKINENYGFGNFFTSFSKLIKENSEAHRYGFKDKHHIKLLLFDKEK
jgi:abortive infection bacteriophage resistance protein